METCRQQPDGNGVKPARRRQVGNVCSQRDSPSSGVSRSARRLGFGGSALTPDPSPIRWARGSNELCVPMEGDDESRERRIVRRPQRHERHRASVAVDARQRDGRRLLPTTFHRRHRFVAGGHQRGRRGGNHPRCHRARSERTAARSHLRPTGHLGEIRSPENPMRQSRAGELRHRRGGVVLQVHAAGGSEPHLGLPARQRHHRRLGADSARRAGGLGELAPTHQRHSPTPVDRKRHHRSARASDSHHHPAGAFRLSLRHVRARPGGARRRHARRGGAGDADHV